MNTKKNNVLITQKMIMRSLLFKEQRVLNERSYKDLIPNNENNSIKLRSDSFYIIFL